MSDPPQSKTGSDDGVSDEGSRNSKKSRSKTKVAAVVAAAGIALCAGAWWVLRDRGLPPPKRLQIALDCLNEPDNPQLLRKAEGIAHELEELDYRDPDFAGAIEFILGVATFRKAESRERAHGETQYVQAAKYLKEADRKALQDSWRPQWAYALGVSLLRIGSATEARPLLEEAVETFAEEKAKASILLSEIYLDLNSRPEIETALGLNDWLVKQEDLTPSERDRVYLQRAQICQLLGREQEAQSALEQVSQERNKKHGAILMNAQTLMAAGKYEPALELLQPLANTTVLDEYYTRQALYRMGLCSEQLAQESQDENTRKLRIDAAISYYERTSQKFPNSHESLAADLHVAGLFRTYKPTARNEEALEKYRLALHTVRKVEDFRNRWISLDEFRQSILRAWNEWIAAQAYEEAIALTQSMVPLFSKPEALELTARAYQHWAEDLETTQEAAPSFQRKVIESELRSHWRASGRAFADLAELIGTTSRYPDILLASANHYDRGHDYQKALAQIEKFIALQRTSDLPQALVHQGEILMHLGRHDEATDRFQRVISQFPTDPFSFRAQYIIGQCLLEQDKVSEAERAWRDVLASESLTPAAEEWRQALFALGRLLYRRAELQRYEREKAKTDQSVPDLHKKLDAELALWDEAIARLDEFLQRYPQSRESDEAAYLLAQALARSARLLRVRLASAETENSRQELSRRADERLKAALPQFRLVQARLSAKQRDNRLDGFGHRALRDSYFEIAHTHLEIEEFGQAITAYRTAIYKYPDDPQVLLAYIQMAHCFARLGKPAETQSLLEQAKVILRDLPEEVFQSPSTNTDSKDWEQWIGWVGQMHRFAETDAINTPPIR